MPETYRGFELNKQGYSPWGDRENALQKQIIDTVLDADTPVPTVTIISEASDHIVTDSEVITVVQDVAVNVYLPQASTMTGKSVIIKKIVGIGSTTPISIIAYSGDTIEGQESILNGYAGFAFHFVSVGLAWIILSYYSS